MVESFLDICLNVSLLMQSIALILCVYRVIVGPTLPDRVLALDTLVAVAIGYIAVIGILTGFSLYVDIAIALGLVGFLATVAFARFILISANKATPPLEAGERTDAGRPFVESGEMNRGEA